MKGQVSIDMLFGVLLVLALMSIFTGYSDYVGKTVAEGYTYIVCGYIASSAAYHESLLKTNDQSSTQITYDVVTTPPYESSFTINYSPNLALTTVRIGGAEWTCSVGVT